MEKSYLEIRVTFIHIFILLIAVILIGVFLFYLGFQAGKSSIKNQFATSSITKNTGRTEKIELQEETVPRVRKSSGSAIDNELKLHKKPVEKKVTVKPLKKESYYSIQVGAYAEYSNAKKESDKFSQMGYQTEILSIIQKKKKLYRVRVGRFNTPEDARKEKIKLEKKEKRNFDIIKSD